MALPKIQSHMKHAPFLLTLLSLLTLPLTASEFRSWRNAGGDKSIDARFVKRDHSHLTIIRRDHREITVPLSKIHADDLLWLNNNHPLADTPPAPASPSGVIDKLRFGDTRSEVTAKLKSSSMFATNVPDTMLARTGLNGIFHTKNTIGGYPCTLSFTWDEEDKLKEITLQTPLEPASAWETKLKPCFSELIKVISILHGKPLIASDKIDLSQLENGSITANYLWHLQPQGSVLLGPAMEDNQFLVVVRFTEETHQPQPDPKP